MKLKKFYFLFILLAIILLSLSVPSMAYADNSSNVSAFVSRFYQTCLDRSPDAEGLSNWTNYLVTGKLSGSEVARGFIFSPEFISKNVSDEKFLDILYYSFFNREPDPVGFKNWLEMLMAGARREEIFRGFINSQEFTNLCLSYGIRSGSLSNTALPEASVNILFNSTGVESELLLMINKIRVQHGIPQLAADHSLNAIARNRSEDMLKRNYFSHTTPEGLSIFNILANGGITYSAAAECLFKASCSETATSNAIFNVWLENSAHRANILNYNYTKVGIGVIDGIPGRVACLVLTN